MNTTVSYNRPPTATITAVAGSSPARASFTVKAQDPEGDNIIVVWHPPGLTGSSTDVRNTFASGGSATLPINFGVAGTHTLFVEVRDDEPRYGDGLNSSAAGDGFQTLLRVFVTLPGPTLQVASTEDVGTSQQVLAAIASTQSTQLVSHLSGANTVSNAAISFSYGASTDQGANEKTSFTSGESVIIAGGVNPLAADVGKAADIFFVIHTKSATVDQWSYLDRSGVFVPWAVTISTLQPAYSVSSLKASEAFQAYSGKLIAADHRVFVGYRLSGGTTLFYTGTALRLSVTN